MPAGNYGGGMLMGAKTELQAGADVNFFMYPPADPANEGKQVIGGHVTYAFKNSPQAQAFMKYQASAAWQNLLASTGQWAVANNTVQPTVYPNELIRNSAVQLSQSPDVVAGPSFRAPADVLLAYQKSIISYIQKPGDLPKILADLDKIKRS
jgi:alpha-glucoside transport system substrate-binding protein